MPQVEKKGIRRNIAILLYDLFGHAPEEEPQSRGLLNLQFCTLPWSSILMNNAFSQNDIWPSPNTRTPAPGVFKL